MGKKQIKNGMSRATMGVGRAVLGLGVIAVAGLLTWDLAVASTEATACDATTGATCKVVGITTTTSSATVSWTEQRHSSSRTFCYGIGTPTNCAEVSSRASGVKNQVTTGLTANTVYAYKFYGTYHGSIKSIVTGTFKTDGSSCGSSLITTVEVAGTVLTATGDSLEHVVVTITKNSTSAVVGTDTTDRSGTYHFAVDPGSYTIKLSYPPFTAPAPYTATVVSGKPLSVPDQIMTGAYQIGGTVVSAEKGDSLMGAMVMVSKNNAQVTMGMTDFEGHFNFAVAAGTYTFDVTYLGKTMSPPVTVTISKSTELPKLVIAMSTSIRMQVDRGSPNGELVPVWEGFDVKGARLPVRSAHEFEVFRNGR